MLNRSGFAISGILYAILLLFLILLIGVIINLNGHRLLSSNFLTGMSVNPASPCLIHNAEEFRAIPNNAAYCMEDGFTIVDNIDLNGNGISQLITHLDGGGYTISNLRGPLFNSVGNCPEVFDEEENDYIQLDCIPVNIKDLNIEGAELVGNHSSTSPAAATVVVSSAIFARSINSANLENINISGSVSNANVIAGLAIGITDTTIERTSLNVNLTPVCNSNPQGGRSQYINVWAVGHLENSKLDRVSVRGNINTIGGSCSWWGSSVVSGFIGSTRSNSDYVTNSYSLIDISLAPDHSGFSVAGLVNSVGPSFNISGNNLAEVSNTYFAGSVGNGGDPIASRVNQRPFLNVYWDSERTNRPTSIISSATPLNTNQFTTGSLPNGFNSSIWARRANVNDGYPCLIGVTPDCN